MAEEIESTTTSTTPNKTMGILSYLGILWFIPFFMVKKENRDAYMHCHLNQGLGLMLFGIIAGCFQKIYVLYLILLLVFLAGMVIGIINANKGEIKELPYVGKFFSKFNL